MNIVALLRERRLALGWTQEDLAAHLKTQQSSISSYENNKVQPSLGILIKWAFALGFNITLEDVL